MSNENHANQMIITNYEGVPEKFKIATYAEIALVSRIFLHIMIFRKKFSLPHYTGRAVMFKYDHPARSPVCKFPRNHVPVIIIKNVNTEGQQNQKMISTY